MGMFAVKNDKGEWLSFDSSHESVWYTNNPTFFNDKSYAEAQNTGLDGSHVVELFEVSAKIVVSAEEAEMLEQAKCDDDPAELIVGFVNSHDKYDDDSKAEDRLMRAYVIGWTVEKPKRWNVKVPHATNSYYYDMGWGNGLETQDMKAGTQPLPGFREAQFTQDEINKRGLQHCERVEVTDDEQ